MVEKKILSTKGTPEISLNPNGIIEIRGRSMNGNVTEFTNKIEEWVDKYVNDPAETTFVDFYLEYFNEINLKIFISVLKKIESVKLKNKKYIINWFYEEGDEDILENGEYISSVLDIPFNFVEISDALVPVADTVKVEDVS